MHIHYRNRRLPGATFGLAILLAAATLPGLPAASAQTLHKGLCFGTLRISPAVVHIGGQMTLTGTRFTCTTPGGKLFPVASILMYLPRYGFTPITVHVRPNGTYAKTIRVPSMLLPVSAISGGSQRKIATRPGMYYFSIRLFDVYLPPVAQANAHVKVVG